MHHSHKSNGPGIQVATKPSSVDTNVETNSVTCKDETLSIAQMGSSERMKETRATTLIDVLLVDDHALMREGLRQLLTLEPDIRVVGEAVNGFEALAKVHQLRPAIVLLDIRMPLIDGLAVTRQLAHEFPAISVIMLTMFRTQQQMLQAMKNGARGYLLKSASSQEVAAAIRTVYNGGVVIEPELAGTIVHEYHRLSDATLVPLGEHSIAPSALTALTRRDIEILRYVAAGMSNKEIAQKLSYAEKTVKNYLSLIFQKLGIRDRTQAAIFALRQGLLPEEEM